jgi:TP901 family phage tail tape measure protein
MALSEVADLYIILRAVTKPFTDSMAKAGIEGEATGTRIGTGIGKVSPVLMGIAAATGLAAAASVKWATDFETQYTRLYTAAGASKDQVLANRDAILQLGTQTGFTGTQIAEALYHPVSAGLSLADALQVVKYSAEEARISGASLDDTTYSLSSVMKAFTGPDGVVPDASKTMAQLNAIVGDGDMRFQDFNNSIKNWAPTAAGMHISIQSMGAALAYLTDRGMAADVASTRVTMGLVMMATPSAQAAKLLEGMGVASADVTASTAAMADALKKAHVTQNELALDLQKPDGINVALSHLRQALTDAGVSGTEADSTLSKIFGGGRSDKAILALMSNLDGLKQKYDQIGQDSTAQKFQQDWSDAQKTTAVEFDKLKAQVINLGIQFGLVLLPPLKEVLGYISGGIDWITKHREAMIALAGVITGVVVVALAALTDSLLATAAAALANPVVDIIGALALGAIEIMTHWKQVKDFFVGLFSWLDAHKTIIAAVLAPMFPVLTAIGVAAYEVITHWKEIWSFLSGLGSDIKQWALDVAGFYMHIWDDTFKWAKIGWDKVTKVSKEAWEDLKKDWNDTVSALERIWNDTGGKAVTEIKKDWESSTAAISKEWRKARDDLSSIWGSISSIWDNTGGRVLHVIALQNEWIVGVFRHNWNDIKQGLYGVWEAMWAQVKFFLDLMSTSIKVSWDGIKGVAKITWDLIWNTIKLAWDQIWGYVKISTDLITHLLAATWETIKGSVIAAWDLISGLINTSLDFIKDLLKLFSDFFSGHWSKLWGDIKQIASDLWHNIWGTIGKVLNDIINTVVKAGNDLIHGFWKALEDGVDTVRSGIQDIWKAIINFFKDVGTWLYQSGKDLIQGLVNGIMDMTSKATDAVGHIASSVWDSAKHGFGLWSPSHIAYGHGQMIVQGLINGMESMRDQAAGTMLSLAGDVNAGFNVMGVGGGGGAALGGGAFTSQGAYAPGTINIYVEGSVLSDRDLRDVVQEQMLQLGARYSTSYTPYKR